MNNESVGGINCEINFLESLPKMIKIVNRYLVMLEKGCISFKIFFLKY